MKYIIMADGKGSRWKNYRGMPKHLVKIKGETLLARTVRLIKELDGESEVIITSHDDRYNITGAKRHEPLNNKLEIDRFTEELIDDDVCFLYGDTYYTREAMKIIVEEKNDSLLFFGNSKSIVAIKVETGDIFREHVDRVRRLYLEGRIKKCIGWQVYESFSHMPFEKKQIGKNFVIVDQVTKDFNTPEEYLKAIEMLEAMDVEKN